jgi:uncharacterized protein (DUF924 family)
MAQEAFEAVLSDWFGPLGRDGLPAEAKRRRWFGGGAQVDAELRERFGAEVEAGLAGHREAWAVTPRGRLALVILLDQFPRNIFRETARAFAGDARALRHARVAVDAGEDTRLAPVERQFLYLPFEHAEDPAQQALAVALFERLAGQAAPPLRPDLEEALDYARRHQVVIERFGRFPARNAALGRASTAEERAFLAEHPHGF